MPTYNLPTNFTDPADGYIGVAQAVPALAPGILFLIFMTITFLGYNSEERKFGRASMLKWLTLGSFITTSLAFIGLLVDGLVDIYTVATAFAFFIGFAMIWLATED